MICDQIYCGIFKLRPDQARIVKSDQNEVPIWPVSSGKLIIKLQKNFIKTNKTHTSMRFSVYLGAFAAAAVSANTSAVATDALTPAPIDFFAQTSVETMTDAQLQLFGNKKGKASKAELGDMEKT